MMKGEESMRRVIGAAGKGYEVPKTGEGEG